MARRARGFALAAATLVLAVSCGGLSAIGVYSLNRNAFDLVVVFALGVIGFLMKRYDYPLGPVILGIVLGPLIDNNFRRAPSGSTAARAAAATWRC